MACDVWLFTVEVNTFVCNFWNTFQFLEVLFSWTVFRKIPTAFFPKFTVIFFWKLGKILANIFSEIFKLTILSVIQIPTFQLVHVTNVEQSPVAADLWTKLIGWATHLPKLAALVLHLRLQFYYSQLESWYSFYHHMEGRRLSWPSNWSDTMMVYLPTGSDPSMY